MKFSYLGFFAVIAIIGNASAMNWGTRADDQRDYVAISTSAPIPTQTVTVTKTEVPAAITHTVTDVPPVVTRTVTNVPPAITHHVIPEVDSYELAPGEVPRHINTNTTVLNKRVVIDVKTEKVHKSSATSHGAAGALFGALLVAALL